MALLQGKRYSLPNSRIMIHQPLGGAQGQAAGEHINILCEFAPCLCDNSLTIAAPADIKIQANEIMHHKNTLNGYLADFTGQSLDQITIVSPIDLPTLPFCQKLLNICLSLL